jgi:uncharacterized membrane protein
VLRTVAIGLMVIVHFVENLSGLGNFAPGGFAAPLFTLLSGVSYRLWVNAQEKRGKSQNEITKISCRRGLFLIGVGFVFNIFVWLPEDVFNWDILTFLGAALLFLNFARKIPEPVLVFFCAAVFAISPVLRDISHYSEYWVHGYFECDLTLPDVLLGFFVNGFFPVFPWIIFPLVGYLIARPVFSREDRAAQSWLATVGLAIFAIASLAMLVSPYVPVPSVKNWFNWTMFPASPLYVAQTLGLAVASLVLCHRWIDSSLLFVEGTAPEQVASTFSTHSFTIYIFHHVVHLWPLWLYGVATGDEPTAYWQVAMPGTISWPLALAFLVLCYFLCRWMERSRKPGMETLMRWMCD